MHLWMHPIYIRFICTGMPMDLQERYELYKVRIRQLREETGISQEKLAMLLYLDQKSISDYERGRTRIPVSVLIQLAEFFDVSMDYITGVSDERGHFPKQKPN